MVRQTLNEFKKHANFKNLYLTYTIDERVPKYVEGDENRIKQVILLDEKSVVNNVLGTREGCLKCNSIYKSRRCICKMSCFRRNQR